MKLYFNRILAVGALINGNIASSYVCKKMIEADSQNANGLEATAARIGVAATINTVHIGIFERLWNNESLIITLPGKSNGQKLSKKVTKILARYNAGKMKRTTAAKQLDVVFTKYYDLTLAERCLMVSYIGESKKVFKAVKADKDIFRNILLGPDFVEAVSDDELENVYTIMHQFTEHIHNIMKILEMKEVTKEDRKDIQQCVGAISSEKVCTLGDLRQLVGQLQMLVDQYILIIHPKQKEKKETVDEQKVDATVEQPAPPVPGDNPDQDSGDNSAGN